MKLGEFISDRKYLLLFYIVLMTFISLVIYFDNPIRVGNDNILYINLVCFVLLLIYLTLEFFYYKKYFEVLSYILNGDREEIVSSLPTPINYNQRLYHRILFELNRKFASGIDAFNSERKEYGDYINSWVHEIKTPISVTRLIIQSSGGKSKDEVVNSIEDEINSIENYVEQALYFSRSENFSKDYLIGELKMDSLIKELIKKHAKTFIGKKIKVELNNLDLIINSDKKWLFFILDQIISNSLKYTERAGVISIYGEKNDRETRLIIKDNGLGIRTEDLPRVFDKGFTGYNGRNDYKSTGIGLYLSKNLSEKLGHSLTIDSSFGEYTRVTIHFPNLLDFHEVIK